MTGIDVKQLNIGGMHCAGCAANVEKAIGKLDGVAEVTVNPVDGTARVKLEQNAPDMERIRRAVEEAGYSLESGVRTVTFPVEGMHCANCANTIAKQLKKLKGVEHAAVNYAAENCRVEYDPEQVTIEEIAAAVEEAGYKPLTGEQQELVGEDRRDQKTIAAARRKMITSWAVTVPVMVWMIPKMVWGIVWPDPLIFHLGMTLLSGAVVFVPGWETLRGAFKSLRSLAPNMDLLIALGTLASLATGVIAVLNRLGEAPQLASFAGIAGMIMAFHLTGRYIETKAKGKASQAIRRLLQLGAKEALVERDGEEVTVPVTRLQPGDLLIIKPGAKIPADGVIESGETHLDESLATGESMPVSKKAGDKVIGGTVNGRGLLKVRAEKTGKDTFLSQVIRMVQEAQGSKVPVQALADRITVVFVPVIVGIALLTLTAWLIWPEQLGQITRWAGTFLPWVDPGMSGTALALFAMIATLVVACPCALGLATPTALMVGSGIGAANGILLRRGAAIQLLGEVKTVVFDKTGTLTEGKPAVTETVAAEGFTEDGLLQLAAAVEKGSEHPLASAVLTAAKERNLSVEQPEQFQAVTGSGVEAVLHGERIRLGRLSWLRDSGIDVGQQLSEQAAQLEGEAKTVIAVAQGEKPVGLLAVADPVKQDSRTAINLLHELGYRTALLTGDNRRTAEAVAELLGIDRVLAEVMPEDKAAEISRLQQQGGVAMVGDGINDAPALTRADVGIAVGTGTDIAIEAGDIVLVKGELSGVVRAVRLSRATFRKIRQNLFWAFFYNIIMIPLAVLGLMHPVLAEIAMAFSSINVVFNSRRLQRVKLG